jgi:hypothetical protein
MDFTAVTNFFPIGVDPGYPSARIAVALLLPKRVDGPNPSEQLSVVQILRV